MFLLTSSTPLTPKHLLSLPPLAPTPKNQNCQRDRPRSHRKDQEIVTEEGNITGNKSNRRNISSFFKIRVIFSMNPLKIKERKGHMSWCPISSEPKILCNVEVTTRKCSQDFKQLRLSLISSVQKRKRASHKIKSHTWSRRINSKKNQGKANKVFNFSLNLLKILMNLGRQRMNSLQ